MKQFLLLALLFALGVGIGLVITPIGIDFSRHFLTPANDQPVQQKNSSTRARDRG